MSNKINKNNVNTKSEEKRKDSEVFQNGDGKKLSQSDKDDLAKQNSSKKEIVKAPSNN